MKGAAANKVMARPRCLALKTSAIVPPAYQLKKNIVMTARRNIHVDLIRCILYQKKTNKICARTSIST
jgi:hypothetical protein